MQFGGKTNMVEVFMPMTSTPSGVMGKHYNAYKRFVELGNTVVTNDPKSQTAYVVSEKESWDSYDTYFKQNNIIGIPKYLCDKSLNKYYFAEAGMPIMHTHTFKSLRDLDYFKETPFIIKPAVSGGSMGAALCYRVFNNTSDFYKWFEENDSLNRLNNITDLGPEMILQAAVAPADVPYGQLYVECFVNEKSEVFFSSTHEIEMCNGRWTKQLEWDTKDNAQLDEIKKNLLSLVKINGIKNTMFLLQYLRNFNEGTWYPSDWQYRLSYNSLFGRQYLEPQYTAELVRFMTNQVPKVQINGTLQYYQSYVHVNLDISKVDLIKHMAELNILNIPFVKNDDDDLSKFLFITARSSFAAAKQAMLEFEKRVA